MPELLWLLLPVAALSGWIAARRSAPSAAPQKPLPSQYFQGINYLLNEQPDKAIEVFTRLVEVDSDTVETHLALGSLFRRRGEVDRASRIHQNLIARPTLSRDQRAYAMLELGEDFMRAGLLDRAEHLFEQVAEVDTYVVPALRQLLTVYQQEKEWDRAISAALRLEASGAKSMRPLVAQFYCEQAEIGRERGSCSSARSSTTGVACAPASCWRTWSSGKGTTVPQSVRYSASSGRIAHFCPRSWRRCACRTVSLARRMPWPSTCTNCWTTRMPA